MSKTSFLCLCDCLSPLLPASLYPHLLAPPTSTDVRAHTDTPTHIQALEIPSAPLCRLGDGVNPHLKFQSPLSIILTYLHPRIQPGARGPAEPQGQMLEAFIEGKVAGHHLRQRSQRCQGQSRGTFRLHRPLPVGQPTYLPFRSQQQLQPSNLPCRAWAESSPAQGTWRICP